MAHDYGLSVKHPREHTPWSGEPIRLERPFKRVILVNPEDCKDKITVSHIENRLQGTGWFEWEALLARWLVEAIVEAINNGENEADVTKLFTCELQGEDRWGSFSKSQERVIDFIMGRLFEGLEEDDEVMRVRIIKKAICNQA